MDARGKENHMNSFSCVITGHRPTRFKFKYNERTSAASESKSVCRSSLYGFIIRECDAFGLEEQWSWYGRRRSCCVWKNRQRIKMWNCVWLSFEGYDADWDDWHQKRMKFIRKYAAKVLILGEMPSSENYKTQLLYGGSGRLHGGCLW